MKKILGLGLASMLVLTACSSGAKTQNMVDLSIKANEQVISQIDNIQEKELSLQEAMNKDIADPSGKAIEAYIEEFKTAIDSMNTSIQTYKESLSGQRPDGIDEVEVKLFESFEAAKAALDAKYLELSQLYGSKLAGVEELNTLIQEENPSEITLRQLVENINQMDVKEAQLKDSLKENQDQIAKILDQYEKYNKGELESIEPVVPVEETQASESQAEQDENIETKYKINESSSAVELLAAGDEKPVLLTFDDSPQPEGKSHALDIAKTLNERGQKAIFFVNGMFLKDDFGKDQLKQIADMGFEIGNHSTNHANFDQLTYDQTKAEIVETNQLVEEITGKKPRFFRPPFGVFGQYGHQVAEEEDLVTMNWSYGYDFEEQYMNADALVDISLNTDLLYPGANILMHDRPWTSEAIGRIADGLTEKGYTIVDPRAIQGRS